MLKKKKGRRKKKKDGGLKRDKSKVMTLSRLYALNYEDSRPRTIFTRTQKLYLDNVFFEKSKEEKKPHRRQSVPRRILRFYQDAREERASCNESEYPPVSFKRNDCE